MRYLSLLILLIILPAAGQTVYQGKVVRVIDGDTLSSFFFLTPRIFLSPSRMSHVTTPPTMIDTNNPHFH